MDDSKWIQTMDALNILLGNELSALENYNRALVILGEYPETCETLRECRASHLDRILRLRTEIVERKSEPTDRAGAWVFAEMAKNDAEFAGLRRAVGALVEKEERSLDEYHDLLPRLDAGAQRFVSEDVLPSQLRTLRIISGLNESFGSPLGWWTSLP
jgi:hypothetical protein